MKQTNALVTLGLVIIAALLVAGGIYAFTKVGTQVPQTPPVVATSTQSGTVGTTSAPAPKPGLPVPPVHAFGSVTLSLGETARFTGVSITPLSIVEDSRCPLGVMCIQAGTVRVSVRVTTASGSATQTLSLNKSFTAGSETITLTEVQPIKRQNGTIAASEYRLTFDVEKATVASGKCYVGGCSSEVCSDQQGAVSSCIYRPEFACYRTATCERQQSGACGWTPSAELKACLANPGYTL